MFFFFEFFLKTKWPPSWGCKEKKFLKTSNLDFEEVIMHSTNFFPLLNPLCKEVIVHDIKDRFSI